MTMPVIIALACLIAMALTIVIFVLCLNLVDGGGG